MSTGDVHLHRWSGWPGAWCLDCGISDAREQCVSEHDTIITCVEGHFMCTEGHEMGTCTDHQTHPCPSPGSRQFDPYK